MRALLALPPALALASPVLAQQHAGHDPGHPAAAAEASPPDRSAMDHGTMDHEAMDHGAIENAAFPEPAELPAGTPEEAFAGPAHAADAFVGAERMAASRAAVAREMSGMPVFWLQADRAEFRARNGKDGYLWDVQGYFGGDIDKVWFKSEGEGSFGEKAERAQAQLLWSHAIGPWFDLQAGVARDLAGPQRTHAVIGVQGLAPFLFEVDAALFLSNKGDVTARVEAELDQRITQRLILQPRAEVNLAFQDIREQGVGAGIDRIEAGLRLRYEFVREFAPYVGLSQEWKLGTGADLARAAGDKPSATNFVAGIRFWF